MCDSPLVFTRAPVDGFEPVVTRARVKLARTRVQKEEELCRTYVHWQIVSS